MSRARPATYCFSRRLSSSKCLSLLASSHFIPPYWARQRLSVDSLISKAGNTAARSLPALSIASASRSLATISSGRCFFRHLVVIESFLALRAIDSHIAWIRISKAGQPDIHWYRKSNPVRVTGRCTARITHGKPGWTSVFNLDHYCPVISRTISTGYDRCLARMRRFRHEVPVKAVFFQTA